MTYTDTEMCFLMVTDLHVLCEDDRSQFFISICLVHGALFFDVSFFNYLYLVRWELGILLHLSKIIA